MGVSITELLILAIAVGFLLYAFTGSSRIVATVLFGGLLILIAAGLMGLVHQGGPDHALVEVAPQEGRQPPLDRSQVGAFRFFDLTSHGRSFVFVIDISTGMAEGGDQSPLNAAKKELRTGLYQLTGKGNSFQIIAYDRQPKGLLGKGEALVAASTHSVADAVRQIEQLRTGAGRTQGGYRRHWDALHEAFKLKPDVICLITHGQDAPLSSKELNLIRGWSRRCEVYVAHLEWTQGVPTPDWLQALASHKNYAHVVLHPVEKPEENAARAAAKPKQPSRPNWVDQPPLPIEEASHLGAYRTTLHSKPRSDILSCRESLDEMLQQTVADYADRFVGKGAGAAVAQLDVVWDYVARRVVKETFAETKPYGDIIEDKLHLHALVEFDEQDAAYLKQAWREAERERRLWTLAGAVGLVLAVVGTAFGYLKMDTATRGYYSGRLKLVAAVIIVLLACLGFVLI